MRAVVCRAGELTVQDVPMPVPETGQVLLRVLRAGICGSDLHARVHCDATADVSDEVGYGAFMRSDQSVVLGHEFAGEVVSYGPGCRKRWAPGTPVVSVPMIRHGDEAHLTGLTASASGAYAQFVLVSEDMTFEIPHGLSVELAALTEPLAVAHHAVRRGEVGRRDVAVVIGCGPIGLAVVAMLKASGVRTVIASDLSAGRRALAGRVGADIVIDPAVESPFDRCAREGKYVTAAQDLLGTAFDAMHTLRRIPLAPWDSLFRIADRLGATPKGPVIFECVGTPGMIEHVVSNAPFRSRVVVVGVCMEPDTFRPAMALNKEIELRFVFVYDPAEFHETLQMIAEGKVDVGPMITATVGLEGVAPAFDALGAAAHHAKVLIDPMSEIDSL
ncbi:MULTISPECIES: zinc-binding dehydrogenase [Gordonia]|uniref:Zinc-binding dehydrogenase n=1 Tax=Gordonia amicalis TaxID=89053 RepID=A0AAE4RB51_9ACTN|nr:MULTISPECIES: zinc-binding dehydrogenase [Gordonia]ATD69633.1 alcohol dehydrogenase [Gordonia sp. 1D]MBA5845694.1 zinc-binding dehydrogenase [Gordonia amicalis]MCZ4649847.1 zinc-binding dehydrogenase [Gordonia amicalis]MDJ0454579.1 zinc-binding dehydrogenase [Gordonia amicalis]MDV6308681.1 zinc-binding dehydrogenase [Gordonia amicalis]